MRQAPHTTTQFPVGWAEFSWPSEKLHLEAFAEIKLAADGIANEKIFWAFAVHPPLENQIGPVHDRQGLAHVAIGNYNGQGEFAQVHDDLLHIINRDWIHAAERLVEHEQLRLGDQRARNSK